MSGYRVKCMECGREQGSGDSPLRDGWPKCCGYTMRLLDTKEFCDNVEREMATVLWPRGAAS